MNTIKDHVLARILTNLIIPTATVVRATPLVGFREPVRSPVLKQPPQRFGEVQHGDVQALFVEGVDFGLELLVVERGFGVEELVGDAAGFAVDPVGGEGHARHGDEVLHHHVADAQGVEALELRSHGVDDRVDEGWEPLVNKNRRRRWAPNPNSG